MNQKSETLDVDDSDDDRDARPDIGRDAERALGTSLVGSGADETPNIDTE